MKKRIAQLFIVPFLLAGVAAGVVHAQIVDTTCNGTSASKSSLCDAKSANKGSILGSGGILTKVAQTLVYFAGAISVIMVTVAGFKYVTSQGDPGGIQSAKNTLIYALVGVTIAIFGQVIVSYVLKKL
ncbi:MAG TPA: hypothetical protein VLF60_00940 [Candidatus Saccharimonadales bacterium]|nr:hypothetical protein [Candidatus Saccharimonadales bacterium]